jgi:hypothetical protein
MNRSANGIKNLSWNSDRECDGDALAVGIRRKAAGGDAESLILHERTAKSLVLLACAQLAVAIYLRMRSECPRWLPVASAGLLLAEVIEFAAGHLHNVALHVPLGVAIFGGMLRQLLWSTAEWTNPARVPIQK